MFTLCKRCSVRRETGKPWLESGDPGTILMWSQGGLDFKDAFEG